MGVFSKGCAVIREKMRLLKSHFFKLSPDPKTEQFTQRLVLGSLALCGHGGSDRGGRYPPAHVLAGGPGAIDVEKIARVYSTIVVFICPPGKQDYYKDGYTFD